MKRGPNRAKRRARQQRLKRIEDWREQIWKAVYGMRAKRTDELIMAAFHEWQSCQNG